MSVRSAELRTAAKARSSDDEHRYVNSRAPGSGSSTWRASALARPVAQRPSREGAEPSAHRHDQRMPHEDMQRLEIRTVQFEHGKSRKARQRTDRQAGR